jgi:hypothetical protein
MLKSLVGAGTKALGGNRFNLVNVLPLTIVVLSIAALVRSGAYGPGQAHWRSVPPGHKLSDAAQVALGAFAVFVGSVLLKPFQVTVVRQLEGYWGRSLHIPAELRVARHQRRHAIAMYHLRAPEVQDPENWRLPQTVRWQRSQAKVQARCDRAAERLDDYPELDQILPTMLGNILRSGENRAGDRYGLEVRTIYPRLYPLVGSKLSAAMSQQLDLIDLTAAFTVAFSLATLLSSPLLITRYPGPLAAVPMIAAIAAAAAYRGAISTARDHGILLAAVVDVHRFDLLTELHFPLPKTPAKERKVNEELLELLDSGSEASVSRKKVYVHPPQVPPKR